MHSPCAPGHLQSEAGIPHMCAASDRMTDTQRVTDAHQIFCVCPCDVQVPLEQGLLGMGRAVLQVPSRELQQAVMQAQPGGLPPLCKQSQPCRS